MDIANYDMSGNTGWSEIAGDADNYNVRDERGLPHYKLVDGQLVEDSSYPEPEPSSYVSELERLHTLENENDMLTECILEMSEIVYGE